MSREEKRPPHLAIALDGKRDIALAAKALGTEPGHIAWGLLELWEHVWRSKEDVVGEFVLDGCFGPDARIRDCLTSFGFIERTENGWRVRGADLWLFGAAVRGSKGGKKTAEGGRSFGNLKQFRSEQAPKQSRSNTEATPKQPPKPDRSNSEAHPTSNIQHPASKERSSALEGGPEFFGWCQEQRTNATGAFPETPPPGFNGWWLGAKTKATPEQLRSAYLAYLKNKWALSLKPAACTWAPFAKRWAEFVPTATKAANDFEWVDYDGTTDLYGGDAA